MPPGGGRNAVDCALWELEAARAGRPAWELAGVPSLKPLLTTFTLGADAPDVMARGARDYADARAIKIKLTGDLPLDVARVAAVREARPDVWLGVDGNQGFARIDLDELVDALVANGRETARAATGARPGRRARRLHVADSDCRRRKSAQPR